MAYLLFSGENYNATGGAEDLKGKFETIDLAISAFFPDPQIIVLGEWAHVLCLDSLKIVKTFDGRAWIDGPETP